MSKNISDFNTQEPQIIASEIDNDKQESLYELSLEEAGFSAVSIKILHRSKIKTVGDLVSKTVEEIFHLPHMGLFRFRDIMETAFNLGLQFPED